MAHALDDGGSPTQNADLARTLVQQDHVFAVVGVATAFFSGAPYLASSGTPTFGFATENDWTPAPNLFAAYGSIVSYTSSLGQFAFLAHQLHTTSVGVLATTSRSPQRSARPPSTRSTATASTSATRTSPSPTSAT